VLTLTEPTACEWLFDAAAEVPDHRAIVELGVWRGGSLAYLETGAAQGCGASVYGVDPWGLDGAYTDRPHLLRRYRTEDMAVAAKAAPTATLVRGFSTEVAATWDGPKVGLLYVDAVHHEQDVLADFRAWQPHLVPGAIIALDDYCERFDGVRRAVAQLAEEGHLAPIQLVGSRLATTHFRPIH
jgi:cephalosporin hydroxylase